MVAYPVSRTRSDSSFPFSTPIPSEKSRSNSACFSLADCSSPDLSPFHTTTPSSLFSLPSSLNFNKSNLNEFNFPSPTQPFTTNLHPTRSSSSVHPHFSSPTFRSQSAVSYLQLNPNSHPNPSNQHLLAMRHPPATFGTSKKNFKKSFFPNFSNTIRSVPASRCNSEDFADLWSELDRINQENLTSKNSHDPPNLISTPLSSYHPSPALSNQDEYQSSQFIPDFLHDPPVSHFVPSVPSSQSKDLLNFYKENQHFPILVQRTGVSKLSVTSPITSPDSNLDPCDFPSALTSPPLSYIPFQEVFTPKSNRRKNISSPRLPVQCRYFALGQCSKGVNCHFSHSIHAKKRDKQQPFHDPHWAHQSAPMSQDINLGNSRPGAPSRPSRWVSESDKANSSTESRFVGANFKDFIGNLYSLCQDQTGCRYLQKTLEEGNEEYNCAIYNEISHHFSSLLTDPFGNYLSQKLMECTKSNFRVQLLRIAFNDIARISFNSHGTRAIQKIIELLAVADDAESNVAIQLLTEALEPHVVNLIKDSNGNHVIQKCIVLLKSQHNQFVYNAISKSCLDVATHKHGCCVIQRCFDNASFLQKDQLAIVIASNALFLVQDPFGNYVVQYVLRIENCNYTSSLIINFLGHMSRLSCQKFSSNVIEKCIQAAEPSLRNQLIEEIVDSKELKQLLQDSYANYVIQTCLDFAEPVLREKLIERIKPILLTVRSSPYIKRIQARILDGEPELTKLQEVPAYTKLEPNINKPYEGLDKKGLTPSPPFESIRRVPSFADQNLTHLSDAAFPH